MKRAQCGKWLLCPDHLLPLKRGTLQRCSNFPSTGPRILRVRSRDDVSVGLSGGSDTHWGKWGIFAWSQRAALDEASGFGCSLFSFCARLILGGSGYSPSSRMLKHQQKYQLLSCSREDLRSKYEFAHPGHLSVDFSRLYQNSVALSVVSRCEQ